MKPKLAMYWAASCGGCEISLVNIGPSILTVDENLDFMFCPCLLDTKKKDIEALPDGAITLTLFNGAIRTEENREMAELLRRKSAVLVAFGSCAYEGCIPGLANLSSREDLLDTVYKTCPSLDGTAGVIPSPECEVPEGTLTIPALLESVKTLGQTVDVDYFMPGCPPEPERIVEVVNLVISALEGKAELPPKGTVIGAGKSTVCEQCSRTKDEKKISKFVRPHEKIPEDGKCLLEQGFLCMGIATRSGCGNALCPEANMPCTGCYGPPDGVSDQGAKMIGALGSVIDIGDTKGLSEQEIFERMRKVVGEIPDPAGVFYKYSLPGSILHKKRG